MPQLAPRPFYHSPEGVEAYGTLLALEKSKEPKATRATRSLLEISRQPIVGNISRSTVLSRGVVLFHFDSEMETEAQHARGHSRWSDHVPRIETKHFHGFILCQTSADCPEVGVGGVSDGEFHGCIKVMRLR